MEISRGKKILPVKGIVYGVEGIGKTTFAARWPEPLFLDVERGSFQMDVARVTPGTYAEFKECIRQLCTDAQGFRTLVIDSADWLETMMIKHICTEANINSIEKYEKGYGKGWNKLAEDWSTLLDRLDLLRLRQNMNILFVAHSRIKRYEPADDTGHDRYTLTMSDKSADVLKKWSDLTLFVKYDTFTIEEEGKVKVRGGDKRVMFSRFHPCWDAKNRYDLPEKMPFEFRQIAGIFQRNPDPEPKTPESKTEPEPDAVPKTPESKTEPETDAVPKTPEPPTVTEQKTEEDAERRAPETKNPEQEELLRQVESLLATSGISRAELAFEIEKIGAVPKDTPITNYNCSTLKRIIAGWKAITHNVNLHRGK